MPSGRDRSRVMERLPVFAAWKVGPGLPPEGRSLGATVVPNRMPSGRWIDSTWITSAPSVESTKAA